MGLLDTINDKCWMMLDAVRLGDFFERNNLPPVLFPLIIVLLALMVVWLVAGRGGAANPCGDGVCLSTESCLTCPLDCGDCKANRSAGSVLTVEVVGIISEPVAVTLFDKDGVEIDGQTDRTNTFEFTGVEPQIVKATVSCPNGKEQSSRPKDITAEDSSISILLPEQCFDVVEGIDNQPVLTHGNVFVQVMEADTNLPIDALVTAVRQSDELAENSAQTESGSCTINVRSDNLYYLTASAQGYESLSDKSGSFYMAGGDTVYKILRMNRLSSTTSGRISVCAKSGGAALQSGRISIVEVGGSEIDFAYLTPADGGCVVFEPPVGKLVKATIVSPPQGCVSPAFSEEMMVTPGTQRNLDIRVECGGSEAYGGNGVAYVKVIVHDRSGNTYTDSTKITLWKAVSREQIPGTAPDGSLSLGSGGYTEEVTIPANTLIQASVAEPPLEYIDTVSGPAVFQPEEHGSIEVVLGERDRGEFNFLGASVIYTPADPGSPVKVFIQQITFNQTVLTGDNSEVYVVIQGQSYRANYTSGAIGV